MSVRCPIDGKPCPDDLCNSGGYCVQGGGEPSAACVICGTFVTEGDLCGGVCGGCSREREEDIIDDEEANG
jgi:hypothetical protein